MCTGRQRRRHMVAFFFIDVEAYAGDPVRTIEFPEVVGSVQRIFGEDRNDAERHFVFAKS